jgi:putative transposase
MDERARFVKAWLDQIRHGRVNISALCRTFGISRTNGYKWLERFERSKGDLNALAARSRRPLSSPTATDEKTVAMLIRARKARPHWGPVTLREWLVRQGTDPDRLPAVSTIGAILKREGLVRQRARRARTPPTLSRPSTDADCPNAVWCIDFKGQFKTADGMLCYPLTLIDAYSRYLLRCEATTSPTEGFVRMVLESAFREFGLPARIKSDNGTPFAAPTLGGLSRLSVWWIKLGVVPERIEPGKPQQNGRQERMHRTLKRETALPPRASLAAQQRAFDRFKQRYNEERPHQALSMAVPDELHVPSTRRFVEEPPDPSYPSDWETRRVNSAGEIHLDQLTIRLTPVLRRELVGLRPIDAIRYEIYFGPVLLGLLDPLRPKTPLVRTRKPKPTRP